MELQIDLKNYDREETVFKRQAARGILCREGKYLMIFSKYGDYKFPGGGREEGESLEETLVREVREETGYHVLPESILYFGRVQERRKGEVTDVMEMESTYFLCEAAPEAGERKLDAYEAEYEYQTLWMDLAQAIEKNKQVCDLDTCPWVIRDTKVMALLEHEHPASILAALPEELREKIQGRKFTCNSIGLSGANILLFDNDLVLKAENKREESDGEHRIMAWLQGKLPVPQIAGFHSDGRRNYLLMTKLPGKMACDPASLRDGQQLVRLLAQGLQKLWAVDIRECPRQVGLDYRLKIARQRVERGQAHRGQAEPETYGPEGFESPQALLNFLETNRFLEEPVLVHGDYCLPNVFFAGGEVCGYLDLGYCGLGDRWQDIALAVRSLHHNLEDVGRGAEYPALRKDFFAALGLEPDEEKIRYYQLLDELF